MVSSCCVQGCTEKFVKGGGISYFRISSKPEAQRLAWISALHRYGWTPKPHHRICSRHFVTGTWNADPNHVDYVPTINMNGLPEGSELTDNLNASSNANIGLDEYSIRPTTAASTAASSTANLTNGAILSTLILSATSQSAATTTSISDTSKQSVTAGNSINVPIRLTIAGLQGQADGLSSSISSSVSSSKQRRKPLIQPKARTPQPLLPQPSSNAGYQQPLRVGTIPKLKSSHFCEHRDVHRNCCRVIRELAEENQILKAQVNVLLMEVQRLRVDSLIPLTQNGESLRASSPLPHASSTAANLSNGADTERNDRLERQQLKAEDIEIVSNSGSSSSGMEDMDTFHRHDHLMTDDPV